jgi:hypothetical protein
LQALPTPHYFHCLCHLFGRTLILGRPEFLRINAQAASQDSLKVLDRLRAEIRVRNYSITVFTLKKRMWIGRGDLF